MTESATILEYVVNGKDRYKLASITGHAQLLHLIPDPAGEVESAGQKYRSELVADDSPHKVLGQLLHILSECDTFEPPQRLAAYRERAAGRLPLPPEPEADKLYVCMIKGKTMPHKETLKGHGYYYPSTVRGLWRKNKVTADHLETERQLAVALKLEFHWEEEKPDDGSQRRAPATDLDKQNPAATGARSLH